VASGLGLDSSGLLASGAGAGDATDGSADCEADSLAADAGVAGFSSGGLAGDSEPGLTGDLSRGSALRLDGGGLGTVPGLLLAAPDGLAGAFSKAGCAAPPLKFAAGFREREERGAVG